MSGLSRTPGKRVWANTHRGFESRPLRQKALSGPLGPFCFLALVHHSAATCSSSPGKRNSSLCPGLELAPVEHLQSCLAVTRLELEMRSSKGWISLSLALGLLAGGLPAEASEVVKLARLVVSGKRAASEPPRATTPPEPRTAPGPQAQSTGVS